MMSNENPKHVHVIALVTPGSELERSADQLGLQDTFNELAGLYQHVKEHRTDLILAESNRTDLTRGVATKIRRYNAQTDIWLVAGQPGVVEREMEYIDGVIEFDGGSAEFRDKLERILRAKQLLRQYGLIGRSARMKMVAETIERVGATEMAVLIVGPSGSGKELVARAIHSSSPRAEKNMVAVNCGALAEGVLESELFGHAKGAFTGSVGAREGLFSKADGGSIFLDEVGETSPALQVKLLRVLEDGTFYPVGSSTAQSTDARVISATNRDLAEAIADREFREDLYFRLAVVKIVVPPLYERKMDIQPLLQHFWRRYPELSYSDSALSLLMEYDWPGNVRQLRNFAERMAALVGRGLVERSHVEQFLDEQHRGSTQLPVATGRTVEEAGHELIYRAILQLGTEVRMLRDLILSHLPSEAEEVYSDRDHGVAAKTMEDVEREMIIKALAANEGNRKKAAQQLGIGERTLYRKLKKYDLT
jgi:DNA-binding NtrC family response regulator